MANLTVSPTLINVTSIDQNEVTVNYNCDKTLIDIKLSMDNGVTYIDKKSMTNDSAIFDITNKQNNNYTCKLKGIYVEEEIPPTYEFDIATGTYTGNKNGIVEIPGVCTYPNIHYWEVSSPDGWIGVANSISNGKFQLELPDFLAIKTYNNCYMEAKTKDDVVIATSKNKFTLIIEEEGVIPPPTVNVSSVSLNKSSHTFINLTTTQLTATVLPSNATNKNITWVSSNPTIASVSNGLVTAKKNGSCIITVQTTDGAKTATCNITVNVEEVTPPIPTPTKKDYRSIAFVAKPWESYETFLQGIELFKNYEYGSTLICLPVDCSFTNNSPFCQVTEAHINMVCNKVESLGLKPILKMHTISLESDGQGNIDTPNNAATWFTNYRTLVNRYADIVVKRGYKEFIISNEMHNVMNKASWKSLFTPTINDLKTKGLKVSMSMNTPEVRENDGFQYFNELDFYCMNTYPQLTRNSIEWARDNHQALKDGFYTALSSIDIDYGTLFKTMGGSSNLHKEIWLTEVGCIPRQKGLEYPAFWGDDSSNPYNEESQKLWLDAVFDVLENDKKSGRLSDRVTKYMLWDGNSDSDFNPIGNQAEVILDKYWKDETTEPPNGSIVLDKTSYSIIQGKDLTVNATMTNLPEYTVFELRKNGTYIVSAYRGEHSITCYTSNLSVGTHGNLTIVAKEYVNSLDVSKGYVDIATSQEFTLNITGDEGGGTNIPVIGVSLDIASKTLEVGQSFTLLSTITPYNATNKSITWDSSNTNVASVNSGGYVTANGGGNCTITVTTQDGYKTATCSITVTGSTGGGGTNPPNNKYEESCTPEYILDKMYPMGQKHEVIPNGNIKDDWKYVTRWENQHRPISAAHDCSDLQQGRCSNPSQSKPMEALGCWSNVYRVEGSNFTQNTGVEMKDIKVYGWSNGEWEVVQDMPIPNGNFYAESFGGDSNKNFGDSMKTSSNSKTVILREKNKITYWDWDTNQNVTENCIYHPFSNIENFNTKYEYIYTCLDMRKTKWDENGVDDRNETKYCANVGGDWWRETGLYWHSSWQHNKGVAQPKFVEIENDWKKFSMTTVPQSWTNGFPGQPTNPPTGDTNYFDINTHLVEDYGTTHTINKTNKTVTVSSNRTAVGYYGYLIWDIGKIRKGRRYRLTCKSSDPKTFVRFRVDGAKITEEEFKTSYSLDFTGVDTQQQVVDICFGTRNVEDIGIISSTFSEIQIIDLDGEPPAIPVGQIRYDVVDYKIIVSDGVNTESYHSNFTPPQNLNGNGGVDGYKMIMKDRIKHYLSLTRGSSSSKITIDGMKPFNYSYIDQAFKNTWSNRGYAVANNTLKFTVANRVMAGNTPGDVTIHPKALEKGLAIYNCALPGYMKITHDQNSINSISEAPFEDSFLGICRLHSGEKFHIHQNTRLLGGGQNDTSLYVGVVVHELGHTTGMWDDSPHRPTVYTYDRDQSITWLQPSDIAHIKDYFPHLTGGSKITPKCFGVSNNDSNVIFNFNHYKSKDDLISASDLVIECIYEKCLDDKYMIDADLIYKLYSFKTDKDYITIKVHESIKLDIYVGGKYKLYLSAFDDAPYSLINPTQGIEVI